MSKPSADGSVLIDVGVGAAGLAELDLAVEIPDVRKMGMSFIVRPHLCMCRCFSQLALAAVWCMHEHDLSCPSLYSAPWIGRCSPKCVLLATAVCTRPHTSAPPLNAWS